MTRTIPITLQIRNKGICTIQIAPHWAGKGIAIHKPITVDPDDGEVRFQQIHGYWKLTHIPTGMAMGSCMGSLDRVKGFAKAWDDEFAALKPGQAMAPDRLAAWGKVMEEMKTDEQRMDKAVIKVFDEFTNHTTENRWGVEGWVTNEQYLFGKKFIVNNLAEPDWSGGTVSMKWGGRRTQVADLIKALCSICGKSYDAMKDPAVGYDRLEPDVWMDWGFFRFKVYKKGTGHFEFKDLDDWARLNQRVAKIRGWVLPEQMKRQRPRRKRQEVAS